MNRRPRQRSLRPTVGHAGHPESGREGSESNQITRVNVPTPSSKAAAFAEHLVEARATPRIVSPGKSIATAASSAVFEMSVYIGLGDADYPSALCSRVVPVLNQHLAACNDAERALVQQSIELIHIGCAVGREARWSFDAIPWENTALLPESVKSPLGLFVHRALHAEHYLQHVRHQRNYWPGVSSLALHLNTLSEILDPDFAFCVGNTRVRVVLSTEITDKATELVTRFRRLRTSSASKATDSGDCPALVDFIHDKQQLELSLAKLAGDTVLRPYIAGRLCSN